MKKFLILLFILILNFPVLKSQGTEGPDTLEYKYPFEVLITAPRLNIPLKESPFATTVIDQNILSTMPRSIAVDEPLKLTPGVKVDNQADGERVHLSIRGQGILSERGVRGTKVLLDGIPLNDPAGFTPDLFDVDWATVQRIEVLRGPAASLYGGSASAGIINILSTDGGKKPFNFDAYTSSGSFNFWKAFGQVGTNFKNGDARVSISRMMGDGYRAHTHFWANNVWAKMDYDPTKKIHLTPVFGYVNCYHENAEGLNRDQVTTDPRLSNPDAIPKNEFMQTERFTGGLSGVINITKQHSVLFTGFIRRTKYWEAVPSSVLNRTLTTPGGSLQYLFSFGNKKLKNNISAGADIQFQNIDEFKHPNLGGAVQGPEFLSDQKIKQTGIGVFLLDRLEIGPQWAAMVSVRYDQIKNELDDNLKNPVDLSGQKNFSRTTGRIGLTFIPNKTTSLYANFGTGFLPPAVEELANNPAHQGGFNDNLTFATSMGPEVGIRGNITKKFYYDLAGFYLQTENDFDRFRVPERPLETFYKNYGKTRRFGIELYSKIEPCKFVTLQFAYTYSNFKYASSDSSKIIMDDTTIHKYIVKDNFLPNSPEHQLMVDLQFNILKNLSVALTSETYSRSYIDGANILVESVGGFTLFGGRIMYNTKFAGSNTEVSVNARNIFSRRYIAFSEPDPGGNSYQPGTPIEVFLNVRVGF